jgi:lambda family phage tail tape measure protein
MATNDTVVLYFKLSDLGETIKSGHKDLKAFKGTFDALQRDMNKPTGKGKGGWKNAMMGGDAYDVARGSAGATGASGRDFANQARGLDGLVRLYATYAANLFAAGAAFRALSQAADTTNMIKGMDQLGAASGQALGTIAKRLVDTTDGAISFREAIEATTKGTAAGLSAKQMQQLGEVANKASKALGVAMPDAISRLTRGISKLEPELLDELGLFTKIDPAVQAYARTLGKTTTSLTDFERRQAFATAVLKEGLDKFSDIDVKANPYDKLLASLQNLGQGALELVNKILAPIVTILSQNPTALLAVIGAIGVSILKSAIPALGHFRENLKNAANDSRMVFTKIYSDQQEKIGLLADTAGAAAAEAYKKGAPTIAKIQELEKSAQSFSKGRKDFAALAGKDPFAITPEEIKSLENRAKYLKGRNDAEAQALTLHLQKMKAIRAGAAAAFEAASTGVIAGTEPGYTTPGSNDIINKRTLNKLASESIRSTTAETQAIYGSRAAYKKLNEEIAKAREGTYKTTTRIDENGKAVVETTGKMGKLEAGYTRVAGVIGIVGQKLGSLLSAFGIYGAVLGIAIEAIGLFDSWMSKTGKQTEEFNKSLDGSKDAIDNVGRTLDYLNKKGSSATITGISALSNAMNELTSATDSSVNAAEKLKQSIASGGWYDKLRESILGIFGKDVDTELAKTLANSLQSMRSLMRRTGMGADSDEKLKDALGVEELDIKSVTAAFKSGKITVDKYLEVQKKLNATLGNSSANLQAFKAATDSSTKAYQEFIQSTANSNPLFKLGASLQDVSIAMGTALKGGVDGLNAAFNDLTAHPEKAALFGDAFVKSFVAIRTEFKNTFDAVARNRDLMADYEDKINDAAKALDDFKPKNSYLRSIGTDENMSPAEKKARDKFRDLQRDQEADSKIIDTSVFIKAKALFVEGIGSAFSEGAKIIDKALGQASAKAALTIAQARSGALSGERAAIESNRLKDEELKIQIAAVDMNMELIGSQERLIASIDAATIESALGRASTEEEKTTLKAQSKALEKFGEILRKGPDSTGRLPFETTGSEEGDAFLQARLQKIGLSMAMQQATKLGIQGQRTALGITGEREVVGARLQDTSKIKNLEDAISQQKLSQLNTQNSINNAATEGTLKAASNIENEILENKQYLERLEIQNKLNDADKQAKATNESRFFDEITFQTKVLNLTNQRQKLEKDSKAEADKIKLIDLEFNKQKLIRDTKTQSDENALKMTAAQLGANQELFNVQTSMSMVVGEEAEYQRKYLEQAKLSNDISQSELSLAKQRADVLAEIDYRLAKLNKNAPDYDVSKAQLEAERAAADSNFTSQQRTLSITNEGRRKALDLTQSLTDRQLAYADVFKQSFDQMGDALIQFTKTGKLNFKGLVDSMIEGLIRYEMQQQSLALYAAARPWLMNLVGSVFGSGVGPITANPFRAQDLAGGSTIGTSVARGGVYDAGLQKFAKGGMFTNGIVSSPTLFKFAKGTGLMGEAGPEAIMPLKRDGQGNLGVRAAGGGGKVDVVVNNYGNQQATTKETTDSRGNRKIEVIIGDMVASEVSRPGSSVQQSLANGFNNRPALARR